MSTTKRVIYTLLLVAFVAALQLGTSVSREHYRCPACHNKREVLTTTVLFVPVFEKEANVTTLPALDHQHQWLWEGRRRHSGVSLLVHGTP